jgi:uncharacterized protein YlxP (DUF503 family)
MAGKPILTAMDDTTEVPVAKLTVEVSIGHAQSIKDRRQVVRSLKDKLRHGFNVSVAELDDASLWNRATLGVVAISGSTAYLTGQMKEVDDALHRLASGLGAEILESWVEILDE